ncbi:hypothetical protein F8S13_18175 [Chloroflexia bacterium SDU3-3]|nr:hypothetical protein F8S13_18175 [Chloroflexia bacterium SDU3-3]
MRRTIPLYFTITISYLFPLAACLLALAGCGGGAAQAAPLPAERAVAMALAHAQADSPAGKLVGMPSTAHGKLASYGEAATIASGTEEHSIPESQRNRRVWLVIFEGDAVAQLAPAAGSMDTAKDERFSQVAVIIDAVTGEGIEASKHSAGNEVPTDGLPALALPSAAQ